MARASSTVSPIAESTCDGVVEPGGAGGAGAGADPVEVEGHEERLPVGAREGDGEGVGQARRPRRPFTRVPGHGGDEPGLEPVAQAAQALPVDRERRHRRLERGAHAGDAGQVLGAGPPPPLLVPAGERARAGRPGRSQSAPAPRGPPNFWPVRSGEVDPERGEVDRDLPGGLHRVAEEERARPRGPGRPPRRPAGAPRSRCWRACSRRARSPGPTAFRQRLEVDDAVAGPPAPPAPGCRRGRGPGPGRARRGARRR